MLWCGSTALADLKLYAEGFWGKKKSWCLTIPLLQFIHAPPHHPSPEARCRWRIIQTLCSKCGRRSHDPSNGRRGKVMGHLTTSSWFLCWRMLDFTLMSLLWHFVNGGFMQLPPYRPCIETCFFWLWVLGPHMMTNWRKQHYISTWSLILHCINIILKLQYINTIYTYTQKCMVSCLGCTGWYKAMRSDLDETSEDELLDLLTCHRPATWISNSFPMCSSCGTRKFRIPKLFPYSWGFSWAICMGAAVSRCASEPEGWPWTPSAPHERWPHDFGGEACSWWIPRHTTWWVSTSWWVETSESITGCLWKNFHGPLHVLQVTKTRMYRWKGVGTLHYNHQSFPGEVFTDDV